MCSRKSDKVSVSGRVKSCKRRIIISLIIIGFARLFSSSSSSSFRNLERTMDRLKQLNHKIQIEINNTENSIKSWKHVEER